MDRPEITADEVNIALYGLQKAIAKTLNEKGTGGFVSHHEILDTLSEEFREVEDAVRSGDSGKIIEELFGVAVVSVLAVISLRYGGLDS